LGGFRAGAGAVDDWSFFCCWEGCLGGSLGGFRAVGGAVGDPLLLPCWGACFGGSLGGFRAAGGAGDSLVLSLGSPNLGGFLFVSAIGDAVAGKVGMVKSGRVCLTRLNVTDNIHSGVKRSCSGAT